MVKRQLSDVLDECLALMVDGQATLEECLARYPQHAAELRPLLEVALRINRLPQPSSSPTAFAAGKRRMLRALAERKRYLAYPLERRPRQPGPLSRFRAWIMALLGGGRMAPARAFVLPAALAGIAAFIIVGGLLFRSWQGMTLVRTATLEAMGGVVEVRPAGSGTWLPASPVQLLKPGDRIRTGSSSTAVLAFFDGSKTALEAGTELTILEMRSRRDGSAKVIVLYQQRGQTYHRVRPLPDPASRFEVETPAAVTVVHGTEFAVAVKADGTTEVKVREGRVKVIARGKAVEVPAKHATSVKPDLPPAAPFVAPAPSLPLLMETPAATSMPKLARTPTPTATPMPTQTPVPPTPTQAPPSPTPTKAPPPKPTPTFTPTPSSQPTATPVPTETPPPEPTMTPTEVSPPPTPLPPEPTMTPTEVSPPPTPLPPEPTMTPTEVSPPPTPPPPEQSGPPQS